MTEDGEVIYEGETELLWDWQTTVERDGERIWVDVNWNEWKESELIKKRVP